MQYQSIHVVHAAQLDSATAQTPGSKRFAAIHSAADIDSPMWGGLFIVEPGARTGIHHHGEQHTIAYVLSGSSYVRWGERGEFDATLQASDFLHVPAWLPHQEINPSSEIPFQWIVVRSTSEPIVVNLPDNFWDDINPGSKQIALKANRFFITFERGDAMSFIPNEKRYDGATFRRSGRSGIVLPPISVGLWQNFGGVNVFETGRAVVRRAFDRGVTHFDLANNYGPPYGSAEENFGEILRKDFRSHRNELLISTKAGWDMWPGPYGLGGSRKYLLASLDESLARMGLEYVDIFYSHRPTTDTPLEETIGALAQAVRQGKALYVGISSYSPERTREAAQILKSEGVPLLIHQPSYSLLNRWVEKDLLGTLEELGVGCIAFSPLAQGLLTDKYLSGVPENSRVKGGGSFPEQFLNEENLSRVRALNEIARGRGQSLAQMAIAWVLRDKRITSALIGARNVEQLDNSLDALKHLQFSDAELSQIDRYAQDGSIDLWKNAREGVA